MINNLDAYRFRCLWIQNKVGFFIIVSLDLGSSAIIRNRLIFVISLRQKSFIPIAPTLILLVYRLFYHWFIIHLVNILHGLS